MHPNEDRQKLTDDELCKDTGSYVHGHTASVEMMRRLKDAVLKLEKTSSKQQQTMIRLTYVIVTLTVVLAVIAVM